MGAFEGEYMSDRDHLTYSREVMTRKYAETYRKREELKLPKRCGAIGDAAFRNDLSSANIPSWMHSGFIAVRMALFWSLRKCLPDCTILNISRR